MHWFSIVAIGVAANIDNLGIGLSFGSRATKVPFLSNLLIALLSLVAAYMAMSLGQYLSHVMASSHANLIGGVVILILGAWGLRSGIRRYRRNKAELQLDEQFDDMALRSDKDGNHVISWGESLSLGFALSINCMASGFGAGASGVSPVLAALSVGLFSLVTVDIGIRMGGQIAKSWLGQYAEILGCLLLILIGCYEVIV
ncbi:sporulation membrane protein YtaF [Paenibacillus pectinilyticus]|uniref:Sporulation membrane protein YtaF n=1 Tax=Paenibacillus pectinilyticus TaxID=512399 RepID=A0A1C0ZYQ7_9BACL|nr:manganese efflux pump [Paenibacillus pectinilyticus]OCT13253.1 sporulation membrane protein YtaF [Paenibacillus pectinilyticus]